MRPAVVVELYPVSHHASGVLLTLKTVTVDALLFQGTNDPLHHAVLLRAVRRNELLLQAVTADRRGEPTAGEDLTVVPVELCQIGHLPKDAEMGDQGLQYGHRGVGFHAPGNLPDRNNTLFAETFAKAIY